MPVYRTTGKLTQTIERDNVGEAQAYLHQHDMTGYVSDNASLEGLLEFVEWNLDGNGRDYSITVVANRELNDDELKRLSSECSGQNSDGLGESFEQQDFAWIEDGEEEVDCHNCDGTGRAPYASPAVDEDDDADDCPTCDGVGYFEASDNGSMASFDWKTNELPWTRIR
jgi:hypothetical protein